MANQWLRHHASLSVVGILKLINILKKYLFWHREIHRKFRAAPVSGYIIKSKWDLVAIFVVLFVIPFAISFLMHEHLSSCSLEICSVVEASCLLLKKIVLWEPPREAGWEQIAFDFLKFREGRQKYTWSVSLWSLLQGKAMILQFCGTAGAHWEAGMWIRCQVSECGEIEELCCGSHKHQTKKPCQIQPPLASDTCAAGVLCYPGCCHLLLLFVWGLETLFQFV